MQRLALLLILNFIFYLAPAQIVSLQPVGAGPEDSAALIFNAAEGNGELAGAEQVYAHHGVVIDGPDGTAWQYVIGNWGQDDGVGAMSPVPGEPDKWQLAFTPSIREYFGVPIGENIFRLSLVFRSPDGNTKGTIAPGDYGWGEVTSNLDIYVDLNVSNFISIASPLGNESFVEAGEPVTFSAYASSAVTSMKLWIDEGDGYEEQAAVDSGNYIEFEYLPAATGAIRVRFTATINGETVETEKEHHIVMVSPTETAELPAGLQAGINYHPEDDTKATLVLEAPGKNFAYVVGDFTGWNALDAFQMKQTPDGEFFWLEVTGLTPATEYVFQYWVDGEVKIGDPYANQVADPWNDGSIPAATYPDLPDYDRTENGIATVLQTAQAPYNWAPSEESWERPDLDHLVIYELLVRDFLASHSYADLRDTLAYIKRLGVDAIELMPFNEFEGNESWGYNPSYYFAPDKYYGPEEELKSLIETAHQMGLAVIMDMVMNHAYSQNPMVQLYFEGSQPAADNPWFNQEYVGPYVWGYDWNHESPYTQAFLDRVNAYWITEYHVDGYRFDFTKGFTNYAPGNNIDGFDQSRIDILERMADQIWAVDPEAYVILEHWGPANEEQVLAEYGMKMWRNRSYDYVPAVIGANSGSFNNMDVLTHVSYFNSHDEQRIAWHALGEGLANGGYNIRDPLVMYERVKMAAAFCFLFPGPKMMWQFDELGYDIDINFNGRVGNKPLPWGPGSLEYYEDSLRQYIYDAYRGILDLRRQIGPANMSAADTDHRLFGPTRRLSYDMTDTDLVLIGNFGLETAAIEPAFTQTGTWYDYFSGESINVTDPDAPIELKAGEWRIYTTESFSDGLPGVVEVYDNPVTITPYPFTKNDEITVTFDATKAWPGNTDGLVGAGKVYFHSGLIFNDPSGTDWENVVGTLSDDGLGLMTEVSEDVWEITLLPKDYYGLEEAEEPFRLGMFFRNTDNTDQGLGFRNSVIHFDVESDRPFVTVDPPAFDIDDEITITFNARRGNRELVGADKVYLHSSVDLTDTQTPQSTAWQFTVGDWGQDNGVGQMSPVPGEPDRWQITLTPRDYYELSDGDVAYWLAAVFRNADGSRKGTGAPGPLENGFIHTNLDFFIRNQATVSANDLAAAGRAVLYPNPAGGDVQVLLEGFHGPVRLQLFDVAGKVIGEQALRDFGHAERRTSFATGALPPGMYWVKITAGNQTLTKPLVKR